MKKKKVKKAPKKTNKIPKVKIIGTSPEHEYGWKDDNEAPKEEPKIGSKEHIENWLKGREAEKKLEEDLKNMPLQLNLKKDEATTKQLSFDPVSGELIVGNPNKGIVVDQIYKDGFFCSIGLLLKCV